MGLGDCPRGHLHRRQVIDVGGSNDPGERIDLRPQHRFALQERGEIEPAGGRDRGALGLREFASRFISAPSVRTAPASAGRISGR